MLVYSDNSAGPERQFSLMSLLKTQARARMTHQMLQAEMHINTNALGFHGIDVNQALERASSIKLVNEP